VLGSVLLNPAAYTQTPIGPIFYGLSGLVSVYFGATAVAQVKK
jgi:hypothetical protein